MYTFHPIGYFFCSQQDKASLPRQGILGQENTGIIQLEAHCGHEQALEGLKDFDKIWLIYCFHCNKKWKPKVLPPRGNKKIGVFATRAPYRPNPIGLSCVNLVSVKHLQLVISNHDLLDGTPILDIKPYLNYADAFTALRQGWLENIDQQEYVLKWTPLAQQQALFVLNHAGIDLKSIAQNKLSSHPYPSSYNRIKRTKVDCYEMAYKTWRLDYMIRNYTLSIYAIRSGYCIDTLNGVKPSRWNDVSLHQNFISLFGHLEP